MVALHTVELTGSRVCNGRPDPDPLGSVLRGVKIFAQDSVGMGFRRSSRFRGQRPKWMRFASDVRSVDISKGAEGGTLLHFEAPRFGDVAGEIYRQGLLFGSLPHPEDTAIDVMGDIVNDVAREVRDSEKFDTGILQRLERFKMRLGPRHQILQQQTFSTGMRAVFGKWPGDESDEEILQTLEDIE